MSWFRHRPRLKEPIKKHKSSFNSPTSTKILEEVKTKQKEQVSETIKLTDKDNESK